MSKTTTVVSPGRPRGTRVVVCRCGRRVAGAPGTRPLCSDCGRRVHVTAERKGSRRAAAFIFTPEKGTR